MQVWIPFAKRPAFEMKTQGTYAKGHPLGCVIHFTAGNSVDDAGFNSMQWGKNQGYAFLLIDRRGQTWQAHQLDRWGYHAGSSSWEGLDGGVSDDLLGIEIASAGRLTKVEDAWYPWFAFADGRLAHKQLAIPDSEVRVDSQGQGWHAYTAEQETELIRLLVWLAKNSTVFRWQFIVGHAEVAPRRKDDPGGALSMTMQQLREKVRDQLEAGPAPQPVETITWFELHRLDEGGLVQTGVVGYAGAEPKVSWTGKDKGAMAAFLNRYPNARNVIVAPPGKGWPDGMGKC